MSTEFYQYLISRGTVHQRSCAYTPGIAERKNRYLLETVRAMMFWMNVPRLGRLSVDRSILDQIAYRLSSCWKHPYSHLKVFGCCSYSLFFSLFKERF